MGMIDKMYKDHELKKTLKPISIKDLKKGDVFYERAALNWYKFTALEDCQCKGDITINKETYKQYMILTKNEFDEERYLLVTEGLMHYNGKYYK